MIPLVGSLLENTIPLPLQADPQVYLINSPTMNESPKVKKEEQIKISKKSLTFHLMFCFFE